MLDDDKGSEKKEMMRWDEDRRERKRVSYINIGSELRPSVKGAPRKASGSRRGRVTNSSWFDPHSLKVLHPQKSLSSW